MEERLVLSSAIKIALVLIILCAGFYLKSEVTGFQGDTYSHHIKRQIANDTNDNDEEDKSECHPNTVKQAADPCAFIQKYCPSHSRIPYLELHYCQLHGTWPSYLILIGFLAFYFYVVGQMADRFFIPSLSRIAKGLKMSESLAGVTLLSLGNGAPDIFATIEAVRSSSYEQAFGQVVGAASFISLGITSFLAIVGLLGGDYQTARRPFLRDVGFLILALCTALWLVYDFDVKIWEPYVLLAVYALYVITVVVGKVIYKRMAQEDTGIRSIKETKEKLELFNKLEFTGFPSKKNRNYPYIKLLVTEENKELILDLKNSTSIRKAQLLSEIAQTIKLKVLKRIVDHYLKNTTTNRHRNKYRNKDEEYDNEDAEPLRHLLYEEEEQAEHKIENEIKDMDYEETEESLLDKLKHYFDWEQKSKFGRAILIISSPLLLIEHATIHWAKDGKYMKQIYVMHPPAITLFLFFIFDGWTSEILINGNTLGYWLYWVFPISFLFSLVIFLTASNRGPPKYNPIFIALGGLVSAMWIDFFANELVSCLGTLGKLFNISDAVMGLTIMAWGNSLSDLITDVLISYRGYPAMVTSVVYSSPITHVLIGLGISFIIKTSKEGPIILTTKGRYPDLTNTLWINFMFLLFGLVLTLIVVPLSGFRFNRFLGVLLLTIYLASIVLSLLDLFNVLPKTIFWIF